MKFIITIVLTCVIFSLYAQEKYNDPLYPESNTVNVTNFKIEGRGLGSAIVLEFLLYYMTKPEYQLQVREAIYLDSMLDLF